MHLSTVDDVRRESAAVRVLSGDVASSVDLLSRSPSRLRTALPEIAKPALSGMASSMAEFRQSRAWDRRLDGVSSPRPDYSAMTVNERLFVAGLLDEWNLAINSRDRQRAIDILGQVDMDEDSAAYTADTVLSNPSKYGFRRST